MRPMGLITLLLTTLTLADPAVLALLGPAMPALGAPARLAPDDPAPTATGSRLSLAMAVELAARNAPAVHAAAATRNGLSAREQEVRGGALPQLSLSVGGYDLGMLSGAGGPGGSLGTSTLGSPGFGGVPGGAATTAGGMGSLGGSLGGLGGLSSLAPGASRFGQVQITVTQLIYDGGRLGDGLDAVRLSQELAESEQTGARRKAQYDAAIAYLNVLKAGSLYEVALEGERQAARHLDMAKARVARGVAAQFEVLQAGSQLAQAQAARAKAASALDLARLTLEMAIGAPVGNLDPDPAVPTGLVPDVERAWAERPELRQLAIAQDIGRSRAESQRKAVLPALMGLGSYVYQPGGTSYYVLGVALQGSLYNGGQTASRILQAEADIEREQHRIEAQRRAVRLEVQSAELARKEAAVRVATLERGVETAVEMHRLAGVRYRAGVGTGTEVVDAQAALSQARSNLVVARFDALISEILLAQALGLDLADLLQVKGRQS